MRGLVAGAVAATVVLFAGAAAAQPASSDDREIQIHGFASEGAFVSTANHYLGESSRGSMELFEAGINVSTEVADRLRFGFQLYGRDMGDFKDLPPRIDFAYFDYRWKSWFGLRGGIIKMPYGLYNEYADVDSSRVPILLPQSVYPLRDRSALLAHTGFAVHGHALLGAGGELDYQVWLGSLNIPSNALELVGATLDRTDDKYVTGAQIFWQPPVDGLRVGATYLRTSIDFYLTLDPATTAALIQAGLVPADFTGKIGISQRPDQLLIGSAEYTHGDWLFAAEYSRWLQRQESTLPDLLPLTDSDSERFYGMATYRVSDDAELGAYYSVVNADAGDRQGKDATKFPQRFYAFQRDAAATVRYDVNDRWSWKVEGHFIDGVADLERSQNPTPTRRWGLFLVKTTVTF